MSLTKERLLVFRVSDGLLSPNDIDAFVRQTRIVKVATDESHAPRQASGASVAFCSRHLARSDVDARHVGVVVLIKQKTATTETTAGIEDL